MKLVVLNGNYPHLGNLLGDVFVHVRVKEYAKSHEVKVFSFFHDPTTVEYEGITIEFFQDAATLEEAIQRFRPDRILIHFYQSWMLEKVIKKINVPVLIWVHGYEALGWYRRLFNYSWYSPVLFRYIKANTVQQFEFRKLIRYANAKDNIEFIFVSNWMRAVTEQDTFNKIRKAVIIANPIDVNLFAYRTKDIGYRKKILLLRSFTSNKYANDIAIEAIELLSAKPFFNELEFTIIGKGALFNKITAPIRKYKNVSLQERIVRQSMIPELHSNNGIFLCPTRQDAQGVSMCEAMSSGLIPVTSNNTAIPEFVQKNVAGFLTKNAREVAEAIELVYKKPTVFKEMSANAAASIRESCSLDVIVKKELNVIEK